VSVEGHDPRDRVLVPVRGTLVAKALGGIERKSCYSCSPHSKEGSEAKAQGKI